MVRTAEDDKDTLEAPKPPQRTKGDQSNFLKEGASCRLGNTTLDDGNSGCVEDENTPISLQQDFQPRPVTKPDRHDDITDNSVNTRASRGKREVTKNEQRKEYQLAPPLVISSPEEARQTAHRKEFPLELAPARPPSATLLPTAQSKDCKLELAPVRPPSAAKPTPRKKECLLELAPVIPPPAATQTSRDRTQSIPRRQVGATPLVFDIMPQTETSDPVDQVGAFRITAPDNGSDIGNQSCEEFDEETAMSPVLIEAELAPDTDAIVAEREELRQQLEFERDKRQKEADARETLELGLAKPEEAQLVRNQNYPRPPRQILILIGCTTIVIIAAVLLAILFVNSKTPDGEGEGQQTVVSKETITPTASPENSIAPSSEDVSTSLPPQHTTSPAPSRQPSAPPSTESPTTVAPTPSPTPFWSQVGHDIVGQGQNYQFGFSVAMSDDGRTLAGGAYFSGANGNFKAGRVRVFDRIDGAEIEAPVNWSQRGQNLDGYGVDDQFGTSVSLSASGTTLAVGADQLVAEGNPPGYVRVFRLVDGLWSNLGNDIIGEFNSDRFGRTVAISKNGNIVAIGAWGNDQTGPGSGNVRVFQYDGGSQDWVLMGQRIGGVESGDVSGFSVSISDNQGNRILAIGSLNGRNDSGIATGHVRVFRFNGSIWLPLGPVLSGLGDGDQFGNSVSLSSDGTVLAVAAHLSDEGGFADSGQVRVFHFDGVNWNQLGQALNGEAPWDDFGTAVAISADGATLVVGVNKSDVNGGLSGHVAVFKYDGEIWNQVGSIIQGEDAGDQFGWSVAIATDPDTSCHIIAAGARGGENFYGHIRVFQEAAC